MVRSFHRAGYQVTIFDIDGATARELAAGLRGGPRVLVFEGDVSSEADAKSSVELTVQELGSLDVLLNNAGIEINATVVEQALPDWDRQLAVNLTGAYLFSKYAIPQMERQKSGCIINISSVHAHMSWLRCPAYDATKSGLIGLTRAMAIDHGKDGIRVNAICPGYIETPLLAQWFASGSAERANVLKIHPLGRIGTPEDVAEAALFLASDNASFISGTSLTVDGALTAFGR